MCVETSEGKLLKSNSIYRFWCFPFHFGNEPRPSSRNRRLIRCVPPKENATLAYEMYGIEKRSNPPGFTTSNCIYNSAHTVWTIYSLPFFPPTKLNFNVGCSQFLFHSFCHIVFCFQDKFDIPIVFRLIASVLDDNVLVDVLRVEKKKNDFKSLLNLISFVMAVGVTHIIHLSSSWLVIFFFYCVCCFCCFGHVVDSVIGHCHTLASANPSITIDMIS